MNIDLEIYNPVHRIKNNLFDEQGLTFHEAPL